MKEISRQIDCGGRLSFCSLTNTVIVLGQYNLQMLDTTQDYSDVKAGSLSTQVTNELLNVPMDADVIYLPPLNQVWVIGNNGFVLIYSTTFKSFFTRQFNSQVPHMKMQYLSLRLTAFISLMTLRFRML